MDMINPLIHLRWLARHGDFYEPMKVAKTMVGCSARDLAKYEQAEGNKKLKYFLSYARMVMSARYCVLHTTYPPVPFPHIGSDVFTSLRNIDEGTRQGSCRGQRCQPYLETMNCLMDDFKNL